MEATGRIRVVHASRCSPQAGVVETEGVELSLYTEVRGGALFAQDHGYLRSYIFKLFRLVFGGNAYKLLHLIV